MKKKNKKLRRKIYATKALFPPASAGANMVSNIPIYSDRSTVREIKDDLFKWIPELDTINYVYLVDDKDALCGVVSIKELLAEKDGKKVMRCSPKKIVSVKPYEHEEAVTLLALQNSLKSVPIVDKKNRILGVFTGDELLDIVNHQISKDLMRISGVSPSVHLFRGSSVWRIVGSRLPWVVVGVLGGLFAALVIGQFKLTLAENLVLAFFIPVIMSTGATVGNQSAMIFIRNLIRGEIDKGALHYFLKEVKIGFILGCVGALLLYVVSMFWTAVPAISLVLGISIFMSVMVSALIGVFIPMVLTRLKIDPSLGAGPFFTIIKDIIVLTLYFYIASLLLIG